MKDYIQLTLSLKRKEEDRYTTNKYSFSFKGRVIESRLPKVKIHIEELSDILSLNLNELDGLDVTWKRSTIL